MQARAFTLALATIAALSLSSCSGGSLEPANDIDTGTEVASMATYACLGYSTNGGIAVTDCPVFSDSQYFSEIDAAKTSGSGFSFMKYVTFTNVAVTRGGQSYTVNGTASIALDVTSGSPPNVSVTSYLFTEGLTIAGPDYSGAFTADLKQSMSIVGTTTSAGTTITMTVTTSGTACGRTLSGAVSVIAATT